MRERWKTRNGVMAGVAVAGWLLVGAVEAKTLPDAANPPENARAGGVPACEEELATCDEERAACEDDLVECEESAVVVPGDGAGSGAPLAYEECADGLTVADLNTGLLWERKVAGGRVHQCLANLHGVESTCDWTQATGDWIDAVNAEGGTGYAGFSDWRVPNLRELQSIVDYGTFLPAIDRGFPGETGSSKRYWSATPAAFSPGFAWGVFFSLGGVAANDGSHDSHVRAVRSGPCPAP